MQNIVDYGEQLTEIAQKEKEAITGIGFDEFKNGYADLLSDLDSTNEDFANNFEKYLQKAIFQSLIANEYKTKSKNCMMRGRITGRMVCLPMKREKFVICRRN